MSRLLILIPVILFITGLYYNEPMIYSIPFLLFGIVILLLNYEDEQY